MWFPSSRIVKTSQIRRQKRNKKNNSSPPQIRQRPKGKKWEIDGHVSRARCGISRKETNGGPKPKLLIEASKASGMCDDGKDRGPIFTELSEEIGKTEVDSIWDPKSKTTFAVDRKRNANLSEGG